MLSPTIDNFSLDISAQPESASTARLFASSLARSIGCDQDVVEDLKVAVSEVFLVAVSSGEARVVITATIEDSRVVFNIEQVYMPTGSHIEAVPTLLVRALFPAAVINRSNGGSVTIPVSASH